MKKMIFSVLLFMSCTVLYAQYKPTQSDVGKDCTTQNGKLGTWKNVTVTESGSGTSSAVINNTSTNSIGVNGNVGVSVKGADVGVGGNYEHSRTTGTSNSSSTTTTQSITYDDIRCVEDKNATLPQQSPRRW